MKEREKSLLTYIIEHKQTGIKELLEVFGISKRTLYYDIESLNYLIRGNGQIKNINRRICYIGKAQSFAELSNLSHQHFTDIVNRKNYILYKVLNQEKITIDRLAEEMNVSRNTVVQTMDVIKADLEQQKLQLQSKPSYEILGDEIKIRNLYLILMQEDNNLLNATIDHVQAFDEANGLALSDYATYSLAKFITFLQERIRKGKHIPRMKEAEEIIRFPYFHAVRQYLHPCDENEQIYLCAYIASLPSLDMFVINPVIDRYVDILVHRFEAASAVTLDDCNEFKKNIRHHLVSSYYRIKYHFPIHNPSLDEIKRLHNSLFSIIKRILENEVDFPDFKGIREEEIGFIAAYFGGYLKGSDATVKRRNKVLLVCPHGLMVSKSLEVQLYKYIPTIQIIASISLKELKDYNGSYDYIISTIDIANYDNVIVVNPMLTRMDIDYILEKLLLVHSPYQRIDMEELIVSIKRNAEIKDETKLRKEIEHVLYKEKGKESFQPMLKDLLNEQRIQIVDHVEDWKDAIRLASQPLLKEKTIEEIYVDAMIQSVEEHGPYIVLADNFALPHASSASGVNELSMALLVIRESVDVIGKPVRLFMVLAPTDTTSHMKALASLSEILCEPKNIERLCEGNVHEILEILCS